MIDFAQNTLDGVMAGSSYALLALGFTLIFGVMRRLNLSFGPSIMVGAYLGTSLYVQYGAPSLVVALVAVAGAALAGIYVERLCFAPIAAGAGVASMVSIFSFWMQLEQAAILILPRHTYAFPPLSTAAPLALGPLLVRPDHLIVLACTTALTAAISVLIYRTRYGLGLRAIINDTVAAHLVGVDVKKSLIVAFALASAIGGLGSIPGAVIGGLVLGIVEMHSQWHFGPQIRDLVAYGLLFACLVLRPGGLFGAPPAGETMIEK